MEWFASEVGRLHENCYLLCDFTDKQALIVDPGDQFNRIREAVYACGVTPLAVLLTHAHFDHIGALEDVRSFWNIPVYMQQMEAEWLGDPKKNGSAYFAFVPDLAARPADYLLTDQQQLTIGSFSMQLLRTPGHSPGGISYYFAKEQVVFCGDTLFRGNIGRSDSLGGKTDELLATITERLMTLPEETVVCPGHGPATTIAAEAATNPFLVGK